MKVKKIKKVVLSLVLFAVMLFSSACFSDYDPQGEGINFVGNIQGLKATYRPETYNFYDFYYDFSYTTLDRLYSSMFFSPTNQELINLYKQKNNVQNVDTNSDDFKKFAVFAYSDINYSVNILKNQQQEHVDPDGALSSEAYYYKTDISWNFNLDLSSEMHYFSANSATKNIDDIIAFYNQLDVSNNQSYKQSLESTAKALQVVVLQTILGKTPTVFTSQNISSAETLLGEASLTNGKVEATGLMGELVDNGTEVGISDIVLAKVKTYILENIIGIQKFAQNNQANNFSQDDYGFLIDEIWARRELFEFSSIFNQVDLQGCVFDEYPAICIKDYESNQMFVNSNEKIAFDHIESAEYQSIVVMPSQVQYLKSLWFYVASDKVMDINFYTRYYDYENNTLYISESQKLTTTKFDEFQMEYAEVGEMHINSPKHIAKIDTFNNNTSIKATNQIQMNYERSEFYMAEPSLNGFGSVSVLNTETFENQCGHGYIEIVFDVLKNANEDEDYNFKVGFLYYGLASIQEVREYNS